MIPHLLARGIFHRVRIILPSDSTTKTFVDYRMGQGEVIHWGKENQLMIGLDLNVPYDVYLDIIDNPDGDGLHSFFLQRDLFGAAEAEKLTRSYELLVSAFAAEPDLVVADATIE